MNALLHEQLGVFFDYGMLDNSYNAIGEVQSKQYMNTY